jgi:hypothetical protein
MITQKCEVRLTPEKKVELLAVLAAALVTNNLSLALESEGNLGCVYAVTLLKSLTRAVEEGNV